MIMKINMKMNTKKLLSIGLVFALLFSVPVQASAKKVTAVKYEKGKKDYPKITTGTYRVTLKYAKGNGNCIMFQARKTGTYRFKLKNTTSTFGTRIYLWKNQPPKSNSNSADKGIFYEGDGDSDSAKLKLKKGDTVYISMDMNSCFDYISGKLTLAIKKVK